MTRTASRFPKSLLSLALSTTFVLSACGGGGSGSGSSSSISLSGQVSGYTVAQKPGLLDRLAGLLGVGSLQAQQALDTVDQVVAIPTNQGNVDAGIYALIEQADIQANGEFELNLDTSYDWVLLLVNSQAQSLDEKVVAYISIPATTGEDIENIPVSQSNGSNMDVGKVQPGSRPRQARTVEGQPMTQLVSLTAEELEDQASYDDSYRHLYNFYLNYNAASGDHYLPLPEARWTARIATGFPNDGQAYQSNYLDPTYDGFYASVMTDSTPAIDFGNFCDSSDTLAVYPPASVTIAGMNFDMGTGMSNATATMEQFSGSYCGHEYLRIEKQVDNELMIQFPLGSGQIPAGLWRMKLNGETLAAFDFSLASPIDSSGLPTGFMPRFTLHPAADDPQRIASISIEWYRHSSNGWEPVDDDAVTDALVRNSFVEFVEYNASGEPKNFGRYDNEGLISGDITPDATYAWYLANKPAELPPNAAEVTDLSIAYEMAGISYRFTWSNGG